MIKVSRAVFRRVLRREEVHQCPLTNNLIVSETRELGNDIVGAECMGEYFLLQEYTRQNLTPSSPPGNVSLKSILKRVFL